MSVYTEALGVLPLSAVCPPLQRPVWDHDAQQLSGGAQPRGDECGGLPERGAQLQHQRRHVQPGEKPQQLRARHHRHSWKQEAPLQLGGQDGGNCGAVPVEQEHTAAQPARYGMLYFYCLFG